MEENSSILHRLRAGDKVKCLECKTGIYITKEGHEKITNVFWCNKCGSVFEVLPANLIVE